MTWGAIKALLGVVPSWCWWILVIVALCLGCDLHGAGRIQGKWDLQNQRNKLANEAALELRREQNRAQAVEQALRSANIQKGYDDEMDKVRADLRSSERLRLGASWCDGAEPARPTEADSAGGGNETNTTGRLLPEEVDRAVKSLILEMEEVAATARAAQAFIDSNGMAPAPQQQ
ncbi:hypothetical protein [Herbaspirillum sp. NPDC101396]|uniref:hypothetical protein n=1 Tax=Herbaspirillum sp. NPDC101396 TaxID=3364005 RepID=UPI00383B8339